MFPVLVRIDLSGIGEAWQRRRARGLSRASLGCVPLGLRPFLAGETGPQRHIQEWHPLRISFTRHSRRKSLAVFAYLLLL